LNFVSWSIPSIRVLWSLRAIVQFRGDSANALMFSCNSAVTVWPDLVNDVEFDRKMALPLREEESFDFLSTEVEVLVSRSDLLDVVEQGSAHFEIVETDFTADHLPCYSLGVIGEVTRWGATQR
jgi:hypothetical protein